MEYIAVVLIIYFVNSFFKKKEYLVNNTGQSHQELSEKNKIPLTGGSFLLLFFFYYYNDLIFLTFFVTIFIIGILIDLDKIKSPSIRIIVQILFIVSFISYFNLSIDDLRVDFLNLLLQDKYFNLFFILFCFLVLINGSNFIDGNNGLSIGYYFIIFFIIFLLINDNYISFDKDLIIKFSVFLAILLIFNLSNFFYLGDNGIYLISIFTGYVLINIINQNAFLSPYFIANLLWYPSFELLFSMIRKIKYKYSPMKPDVNHLHQLIFKILTRKKVFSLKISNSLTGIIINIFNFVMLLLCSLDPSSTNFQVSILIFSIFFYVLIYYFLKKLKISEI